MPQDPNLTVYCARGLTEARDAITCYNTLIAKADILGGLIAGLAMLSHGGSTLRYVSERWTRMPTIAQQKDWPASEVAVDF